jgi:parallel beta-helix repeat protein
MLISKKTIRGFFIGLALATSSAFYVASCVPDIAHAQVVNPSQPATGVPVAGTGINVSGQTVSINYGLASQTYTGTVNAAALGASSASVSGNVTSGTHTLNAAIAASAPTGAINYGTLGFSDTNIFGSFATNVNSYSQFILQNLNAGSTASAGFIVGNNNTTATTNYGEFGINSSGFSGTGSLNLPGATYLTSTTGDLAIGTTTANAIHFLVNSGATDAMTISSSGSVSGSGINSLFASPPSIGSTTPGTGAFTSIAGSSLNLGTGQITAGYTSTITGAANRGLYAKLGDEINVKDFGATCNGVADDTTAIQAAYTNAPANATISYPANGSCRVGTTISITKPVLSRGNGVTITATGSNGIFSMTTANQTSASSMLLFDGFVLVGNAKTAGSYGIQVTNNNPFVYILNSQFSSFDKAIYLQDSYSSNVANNKIVANNVGIELTGAVHASHIVNNFIDSETTACLRLNFGGGFTPTHNLTVVGGAYQGSPVGIWLEQSYDATIVNTYYERNTSEDLQIGASSGGTYARAAYNTSIYTLQSASPVSTTAPKQNIVVVESVAAKFEGLDFGGSSTSATNNVSVDGYSDKILVDYYHTSATTPFSFPTGTDAHRVMVTNYGRMAFPYDATPNNAATGGHFMTWQASLGSSVYDGQTWFGAGISSRNSLVTEVTTANTDLLFRALASSGQIRFADSANVEYFRVDTINGNVTVLKPLVLPGGQLLQTSAALTNGAAAATGTLTNAPIAGNPTKWIPISDNGTTRYIPAW